MNKISPLSSDPKSRIQLVHWRSKTQVSKSSTQPTFSADYKRSNIAQLVRSSSSINHAHWLEHKHAKSHAQVCSFVRKFRHTAGHEVSNTERLRDVTSCLAWLHLARTQWPEQAAYWLTQQLESSVCSGVQLVLKYWNCRAWKAWSISGMRRRANVELSSAKTKTGALQSLPNFRVTRIWPQLDR